MVVGTNRVELAADIGQHAGILAMVQDGIDGLVLELPWLGGFFCHIAPGGIGNRQFHVLIQIDTLVCVFQEEPHYVLVAEFISKLLGKIGLDICHPFRSHTEEGSNRLLIHGLVSQEVSHCYSTFLLRCKEVLDRSQRTPNHISSSLGCLFPVLGNLIDQVRLSYVGVNIIKDRQYSFTGLFFSLCSVF